MTRRTANRVAFAAFAAAATWYAGAKHQVARVEFPYTTPETRYLIDDGSYVTNDAVRVNFARNPIVPASAWFFLDACPLSVTNLGETAANSFGVYSNRFSAMVLPLDVPYPAATNYRWFAYTDWTPSPSVHTNGVAFVGWILHGTNAAGAVVVPYRTGIYADSRRVAPSPGITNGPPVSVLASPLLGAPTAHDGEIDNAEAQEVNL